MIKFDDLTKENIKEHNLNWPQPSKHSSWWRRTENVLKKSWICLQCNTFFCLPRRLQNVSRHYFKTSSWRRLQEDVLQTRLEDVSEDVLRRRLQDVLRRRLQDVLKMPWQPFGRRIGRRTIGINKEAVKISALS